MKKTVFFIVVLLCIGISNVNANSKVYLKNRISLDDQCRKIDKWVEYALGENHKEDSREMGFNAMMRKLAPLFKDKVFTSYFGFSYTEMNDVDKRLMVQDMGNCSQLSTLTYSVLETPFYTKVGPGGQSRNLESPEYKKFQELILEAQSN